MKLSVIIVNYNVKHFLEQCLFSVRKASAGIKVEIFVVDNNSVDGSVEMVQEKFPEVTLIENKKNTGFSYANNQAIKIATGEYILLLNPDTVVEEDTFSKVVFFMDSHPDAGGLGVKMVDGKGNFLPESKRGLPTPRVAFYKIFGLSRIFPKSKIFGRYHLGFLNKEETHEVEILSGAFMLMRKATLDKVGLLDEDFFMYGEDIDLSYRILKGGYKNYYFPKTRIIHYKGESTKKSSVNYVFVFYNAMVIFATKHFSQKNARLFSLLINSAIYLRAFIAIVSRFFKKIALPLADSVLIFTGVACLKYFWEHEVRFTSGGAYPSIFLTVLVPVYILFWILSIAFTGGYQKPVNLSRIIKGITLGTGLILIFYSLLPESFRFSRALILLGSAWTILSLSVLRVILHFTGVAGFTLSSARKKRLLIAGSESEAQRVAELLKLTAVNPGFVGFISHEEKKPSSNKYVGTLDQIKEAVEIYKIDEVIFCAKDIAARKIIDQMALTADLNIDYKIAPPESLFIIGSNSINTSGELYTIDINSISKSVNKRNKRLADLAISVFLLFTAPLFIWFVKDTRGFLYNLIITLLGSKSWVGYHPEVLDSNEKLPPIKPGVLNPADIWSEELSDETTGQLNLLYAKDYRTYNDLHIIYKGFRHLGRR